jgi:hypothetical protein
MNASANEFKECDSESSDTLRFRQANGPTAKASNRQGFGRRRGKSPQQFNGIHRRRRKKMSW